MRTLRCMSVCTSFGGGLGTALFICEDGIPVTWPLTLASCTGFSLLHVPKLPLKMADSTAKRMPMGSMGKGLLDYVQLIQRGVCLR